MFASLASCGFDTSGLGALPVAGTEDAALADAGGAGIIDAAPPDSRAIDASPGKPDAGHDHGCGAAGQVCCDHGDPCDDAAECTDGTCTACGGALESCCDPGATCRDLGLCVGGGCV